MGLVMPPIKVQYSSKLMRPSWLASRLWMSLSAAFRFPVSWRQMGVSSVEGGGPTEPQAGLLAPLGRCKPSPPWSGLGTLRGQGPGRGVR